MRRVREILLVAVATSVLAAGVPGGSARAAGETPPPPSGVVLTTTSPTMQIPDGRATVTAVASSSVTDTGFQIGIFDGSQVVNGQPVGVPRFRCGVGTTCTVPVTTGWADNSATAAPRTQTFVAGVGRYSVGFWNEYFGDLSATSDAITVTSIPVVSIATSISSNAAAIQVPDGTALVTATAGRDLSGSGYSLGIYRDPQFVDGRPVGIPVTRCAEGVSCTLSAATTWSENSAVGPPVAHTYVAAIGRYSVGFWSERFSDLLGVSGPVTVTSTPVRQIPVSVTTTSASVQLPDGRVTATARTDRDLAGSGYSIIVRTGANMVGGVPTGGRIAGVCQAATCKTTLIPNGLDSTEIVYAQVGRYQAFLGEESVYDVLGTSPPVSITTIGPPRPRDPLLPPPPLYSASVTAELATAAARFGDPCIETFPVGPTTFPGSLNDYQRTCETARAGGQSLEASMAAVITVFGVAVGITALVAQQDGAERIMPLPTPAPAPITPRPALSPDPPQLPDDYVAAGGQRLLAQRGVTGYGFTAQTGANAETTAQLVYRQCVRLATWGGSGINPADCGTLPIFAPGNDVRMPAQHDLDVISWTPSTVRLEAKTNNEKARSGVRSGWYDVQKYYPTPDNPSGCGPTPRPLGQDGQPQQCDEYPFYSSRQGGPLADGSLRPHQLQLVNAAQNRKEGGLLKGFYNVCGMTTVPAVPVKRQYLVVPMPNGGPSTAWCGSARP